MVLYTWESLMVVKFDLTGGRKEGSNGERVKLLLLGHLAGDFFHEFGAKTSEDAVDDAGDICGSAPGGSRGSFLHCLFSTGRDR